MSALTDEARMSQITRLLRNIGRVPLPAYPFRLACGHIHYAGPTSNFIRGGTHWCGHCRASKQIVWTG